MKKSQRGQYLLELSAVLSVGLVFMVTAVDFSKALHSYSALQEAVNQSLRCVRATDGCVNVSAGNLEPEYEITTKIVEPRWPLYDQLYGGVAEWLQLPEHRLNPSAEVLSQVGYGIPGRQFNLQTPRYRPRATANFVKLQAAGVFADTGSGGSLSATRNVIMRYKRRANSTYPSSLVPFGGGGNRIVKLGDAFVSNIITAPSFPSGATCFQTDRFDEPGGANQAPNFNSPCDVANQPSGAVNRINMVIQVKGTSPSSNSGESKIRLDLIRLDGGGLDRQGGRVFQPGEDASLVPRGLLPTYWSDAQGYQEFNLHKLLFVKSGERFKVKISMEYADDNDNEWRGDEIRLYFGRPFSESVIGNCVDPNAEGIDGCEIEYNPAASVPAVAPPDSLTNFHRTTEVVGYQQTELASCKQYNYNNIPQAKLEAIQQTQPQAPSNLYYALVERNCQHCSLSQTGNAYACMNNDSVEVAHNEQCPDNYGIAPNLSGSAKANAATAACPPTHPALGDYDPLEVYESATETSINMPQYSAITLKTDCSQAIEAPPQHEWPSALQPYLNVSWTDAGATGNYQEYYTGSLSTAEYKQQHQSSHGCFSVATQLYGRDCSEPGSNAGCQSVPANLPESSVMHGEQDLDCDYEDRVKNDPFILSERDSGISGEQVFVKVLEPVDAKLTEPVWSLTDPHETLGCYNEAPNYDHTADIPGEVLEGLYTKEEIPTECEDGTWQCSLTYVGMRGDEAASSEADTDQAIERGLEFFQTVVPTSKRDCEGPHCVQFTIDDTDPSNVIATASMELPLNLLLKKTVPIRYSATVRPEKYLVK